MDMEVRSRPLIRAFIVSGGLRPGILGIQKFRVGAGGGGAWGSVL